MGNILLVEPNYKNKYPPLGLMKISYFHKRILQDYVRFTKGELPPALAKTKWDHVYVTTLFTFEWANTIAAINYAKTLVNSIDQITVGGIAATMLPEQIFEETGIHPVCGLLNEPGKLSIPGDECIDQIVPDYSMLNDIDYDYPSRDSYFLSATKGCGNNCGFCAVQTLEPVYVPYIDIKDKISAIDCEFGPKKDLLLMDNNVLRSPQFDQIIDDVIESGFGKGATYINPKTGKTVRRYVDFNQGLDAMFLSEPKAKRLGEIALKPARVAFDHIEDRETYERAFRLCAKYGITELSNYVLYNCEKFGGKGHQYAADTPADLYNRMRITIDLKDQINRGLPNQDRVSAFSFPMRYIPLSAHERGYVGSQWNEKFLRAVQCMLIPTQGKGVGSRSFFEADFGTNSDDFVRFLCMPDKLIAARGKLTMGNKGKTKETKAEFACRRLKWEKNQRRITEWNRLFNLLGDGKESFIALIGDNKFLPEKVLSIPSNIQKELYLLYLTTPRIISLLGLVNQDSPTAVTINAYITKEFPDIYNDVVEAVVTNAAQQNYVFKNFISFFGKTGLRDILKVLDSINYNADKQLKKWDAISKNSGFLYVDFELIRVYKRYLDLEVLSQEDKQAASRAVLDMNMPDLAMILEKNMQRFEGAINTSFNSENGQKILKSITKTILTNIQLKLLQFLGEEYE